MKLIKLLTIFSVISLFAINSIAIDDIPDCKTVFYNTFYPKAGQTGLGIASGDVRNRASTWYEGWWREETYFRSNPTNGATVHGFNMKTKTFGDTAMPWTHGIVTNMNSPKGFTRYSNPLSTNPNFGGEPNREDLGQRYGGTGPLVDNVWTPGERFWDKSYYNQPPNVRFNTIAIDEDWWKSSNTNRLVGISTCARSLTRQAVTWDFKRGEYYADYWNNTTVESTTSRVIFVGFDTEAEIWIADISSGTNKRVVISEQVMVPSGTYGSEGDLSHTLTNAGLVTGNIDVPKNGKFDYNVDGSLCPMVFSAYANGIVAGTTGKVYVIYESYLRKVDASKHIVNGCFYVVPNIFPDGNPNYTGVTPPYYNGTANANNAPINSDVTKYTIYVPVYQAGELWGQYAGSEFDENLYIDWIDADHTADDTWTKGHDHEDFQDFLSWWVPEVGSWISGINGCPNVSTNHLGPTPSHMGDNSTYVVSWSYYTNYIYNNYPGNAAALIARTGNGVYDGPDDWQDSGGNNHMQQNGYITGLTTARPGTYGASGWDYYNQFGEKGGWNGGWWNTTYSQYGSVGAPLWDTRTPNISTWSGNSTTCYVAQVLGVSTSVFMGVTTLTTNYASVAYPPLNSTWGYNGTREFDDLSSSMYHAGGDWRLGEVIDPWTWNIGGVDNGNNNPAQANVTLDGSIPAAGPLAYEIQGINGLDAGNQISLELMTRRTDGRYFTGPRGGSLASGIDGPSYTRDHRDLNLDGLIDQGETIPERSVNYSSDTSAVNPDGGRMTSYPFNWTRYFEDCVEAWDTAEDYYALTHNNSVGLVETRIQSPSGFRWVSGTPMTGYLQNVLWHKNTVIVHTNFDPVVDDVWIDNGNGVYDAGDISVINHNLTNGLIGTSLGNIAWLDMTGTNGNKDGIYTPITSYTFEGNTYTIGDVLWIDALANGQYDLTSAYTIPVYSQGWVSGGSTNAGEAGTSSIGPHLAGFGFSCATRDNVVMSGLAHVWPQNLDFTGATHEQGHELVGWPDYYDYNVWGTAQGVIHYPVGRYDLMSEGTLVHGIGSTKMWWTTPQYLNWGTNPILGHLISSDDFVTHVDVLIYPCERFIDQYYWFINPKNPDEAFCFWYASGISDYSVYKGIQGIMIQHTKTGTPFGHPEQQRVNYNFQYAIVPANSYQMWDGNSMGDPQNMWGLPTNAFGGGASTVFSESTLPPACWWNDEAAGVRIIDIHLPTNPASPAIVSFQWFSTSNSGDTGSEKPALPSYVSTLISSIMGGSANIYTADSNSNGIGDFEEFLTGGPTNFVINSMVIDYMGSPKVTWKSPALAASNASGTTQYGVDIVYTIYRKDNLTDTTWTPISIVTGTSGENLQTKYYLDTARSFLVSCGFYKVVATVRLAE